jgi:Raf kinase inhibitor-like YbhB/YbcL family protein
MKIESPSFENNEKIPKRFTADGENINPFLIISQIPKETKSLILIVDDPDAKKVCGFTWIHWIMFNMIPSSNKFEIQENSIPGTPGESTYKKPNYGGPNPPSGSGIHNYQFKIYALDKKLDLPEMTPLNEIEKEMQSHIIEQAILIGKYSRD